VRSHFVLFSLSLSLLLLSSSALAQCRDDRGEPIACTVVPTTELSAPTPVVAIEPTPSEPNVHGHEHRERETGYVDFALTLDDVDMRQLHFSPMNPTSVAEVARGAIATGVGSSFDNLLGGFTVALGFRPVPWLRLPQLRLSAGFGDLNGASVDMVGGSQPLRATFHDLFYLRAELGAGLDLDLDPIRLYALGHIAIAGYFANVTVDHSGLGDLGTDLFAEDTWEAGWTVGMEVELAPDVAYTIAYRHIHTGVESNVLHLGLNVRFQ
jgi:hypothetical protein